MQIKKFQSKEEHTLLAALITHDGVLGSVAQALGPEKDPFPNRWSNLIAQWCFTYFDKYQKAPGRSIQQLFLKWAAQAPDPAVAELVEKYLGTLSDHYAKDPTLNEKYIVDVASHYFERVRLSRMSEAIDSALERDDLKEAREASLAIPIDFSSGAWKDPFSKESIKQTFRRKAEDQTVIQFPGDLGLFLSPHLERTDFVSFCGPEKRGKSWWLQESVFLGLQQKRKVLYYVLGDMSEEQVNRRLYSRLLRRPWQTKLVRRPVSLDPQGRESNCKFRSVEKEGISAREVWEGVERFKRLTGTTQMRLRLRCEGGLVVSASDIEKDIARLAKQEGWVPDLVAVDYADLLAPEPHTKNQEVRHQMNASWLIMRRIGLTYSCLMLTATQAATSAYNAWLIRKKDFSEDKRKNAHVTGMIGINQTESGQDDNPSEKELGVYRLNWIVLRGGSWSESQFVWTAGNLSIGCPCIISHL